MFHTHSCCIVSSLHIIFCASHITLGFKRKTFRYLRVNTSRTNFQQTNYGLTRQLLQKKCCVNYVTCRWHTHKKAISYYMSHNAECVINIMHNIISLKSFLLMWTHSSFYFVWNKIAIMCKMMKFILEMNSSEIWSVAYSLDNCSDLFMVCMAASSENNYINKANL